MPEVDLDGGCRLLMRFMNEDDGQFDEGEESRLSSVF